MDKKMKISDLMKAVHKGICDNLIGFSDDETYHKYKIDGYQNKNTSKIIAARLNVLEKDGVLISNEPISVMDIVSNDLIPVSSRSAEHLTGVISSVICGKIAKSGDSVYKKGGVRVSFEDDIGGCFNITQREDIYVSSKVVDGTHKNNGIHSAMKEAIFESCFLGYTTLKKIGLNNENENSIYKELDLDQTKNNILGDLGF